MAHDKASSRDKAEAANGRTLRICLRRIRRGRKLRVRAAIGWEAELRAQLDEFKGKAMTTNPIYFNWMG